ncbi:O-antigen ligase family protein [Paenibacillus sp. NPDC057967]|uniref:O-antigen ligase family protein n=1 Tax=Paenibacillus sp. NPDC057967 TaxID=3346293 RepID=UPI0036DA0119
MILLFLIYIFLLPFTFLIDSILDIRILDISIMNIFSLSFYAVAIAAVVANKNKMEKTKLWPMYLLCFFYLIIGLKIIELSDVSTTVAWLVKNNYYFVPAVLWMFMAKFNVSIEKIVRTVFISSSIVTLIGIYSFLTSNYFGFVDYTTLLQYSIPGLGKVRLMSIFANPNAAAYYYIAVLIVLLLYIKKLLEKYNSLLVWGIVLLQLSSIILTFSRSAYITLILLVVITVMYYIYKGKVIWLYGIIVSSVVGLLLFFVYFNFNELYFFKADITDNSRLEKWGAGLNILRDSPLLGVKLNSEVSSGTWLTTFSDNEFLKSFIWFGLLGGGILFLLFFSYLKYSIQSLMRNTNFSNKFFPLFIFILIAIGGFFNNILEFYPNNMYIFIFIFMHLLSNRKSEET